MQVTDIKTSSSIPRATTRDDRRQKLALCQGRDRRRDSPAGRVLHPARPRQGYQQHVHEIKRYVGRRPFTSSTSPIVSTTTLPGAEAPWTSTPRSAASSRPCGTWWARPWASPCTAYWRRLPRQDQGLCQRLVWRGQDAAVCRDGRRHRATRLYCAQVRSLPGPWRLYVDRKVEQAAVANVRAVREAVGPDVDLLVEAHRRLAPMHAIHVSHMLEEFHPFWFEEPVPVTNVAALAKVRRQTSIPVVTGETLPEERPLPRAGAARRRYPQPRRL